MRLVYKAQRTCDEKITAVNTQCHQNANSNVINFFDMKRKILKRKIIN